MITPSKLLKSWAIPPESCPTASIFCVWRICFSRVFCSVMSRKMAITHSCPATSMTSAESTAVRISPDLVRNVISNSRTEPCFMSISIKLARSSDLFPKIQLHGSVADHLFARISGDAEETLIHVDVAAFRDGRDGDGFRVGIEGLAKCLFRVPALGDIHKGFFVHRGLAARRPPRGLRCPEAILCCRPCAAGIARSW